MDINDLTGYPSVDKPWLKYYSNDDMIADLPKKTMYQYIYENNSSKKTDVAFVYQGRNITYGELFDKIHRVAGALAAMGISAGDTVTVMSMHTPETVYLIYALNYLGALTNMIYASSITSAIVESIRRTDSKCLFVLDALLESVYDIRNHIDVPVVVLSVFDSLPFLKKTIVHIAKKKKEHSFISFENFLQQYIEPKLSKDHNAPAIIVYTSGTTGKTKGVVLSNYALNAHSFQFIHSKYGVHRGDSFLFILPPFLGFGISHIHASLNLGLKSYLWLDLNPKSVAKAFFKIKPNIFVGGPAFVDAFIENKPKKMPQLRLFVGGGGALPENTEIKINDLLEKCNPGVKYAVGYGLTETSSTISSSTNDIYKFGSVGIPSCRNVVKAVDIETGTELPYNTVGELWISSPSLLNGYFDNAEATEEIIHVDSATGERWLRTGDLGMIDEDGFIYIKGRLKRIYITKTDDGTALKLFPQKIEEILCECNSVRECAVVVIPHNERMNVPVVFFTMKDNSYNKSGSEDTVWKYCKENLNTYEIPIKVIAIDDMLLTPSGKIDYKRLEELV